MSASDIPKDRGVEKVHWLEDFYTYLYTPARGSPQCQVRELASLYLVLRLYTFVSASCFIIPVLVAV